MSKQKAYKIVGITYYDLNLMYLSDDGFINLSQDLEVDLSSLHNKQLNFELRNNEDTTI